NSRTNMLLPVLCSTYPYQRTEQCCGAKEYGKQGCQTGSGQVPEHGNRLAPQQSHKPGFFCRSSCSCFSGTFSRWSVHIAEYPRYNCIGFIAAINEEGYGEAWPAVACFPNAGVGSLM
ncbi:MAG: hypothetical protein RBT68_13245, partial [Spirochaetia bacterium]|nr:hypothetical protein [Spirochaetia bacterium]